MISFALRNNKLIGNKEDDRILGDGEGSVIFSQDEEEELLSS